MSDYPADRQRSGHFARFAKAIFRSDAIAEVGLKPVMLSLFVAAQEDREHYRKPPKIWRAQIMSALAIGSPKDVVRVRSDAIQAGLVHYVEGTRTIAPEYWTCIPEWLVPFMPTRSKSEPQTVDTFQIGTEKGTRNGTRNGTLSNPIPNNLKEESVLPSESVSPKKAKKKTAFQKPTVEEIGAYCQERNIRVDPEGFLDHYESNGWLVGRNPMRDWKASVRKWAKISFDKTNLETQTIVAAAEAKRRAKLGKQLADREAAKQIKAAEAARRAELKAVYEPVLASMPVAEVDAMIEQLGSPAVKLGRDNPMVREILWEALDVKSQELQGVA